ncbi:hypothetical protein WBZ18_13010 [Clostridium botulinum]|uniref:hypothetical protein n=1 Tax=Clostridium botulinum TaxID=1491 RepID=UPI0004AD9F2C|nr:hypothetical protein [Clostridium botulinum]APH23563.1 hypothetical protein NPD1_708 [Clostridium botulinum]
MARKAINTTVDEDLMRDIKLLALNMNCKINDLIEEGLRLVLQKHSNNNQGK